MPENNEKTSEQDKLKFLENIPEETINTLKEDFGKFVWKNASHIVYPNEIGQLTRILFDGSEEYMENSLLNPYSVLKAWASSFFHGDFHLLVPAQRILKRYELKNHIKEERI